jgi:hybrid cluster-associated redox disulfide protein
MDQKTQIQSNWTVEEVLKQDNQSSLVFIRYQLQCAGCYMQKFCKIKDVAEIYKLEINTLLWDLNGADKLNQLERKKEK